MKQLSSAPGKLIILGEYAVLEGAPALVFAVDRRAVAHVASANAKPLSPFLAAAEALCEASQGASPPQPIRVSSDAMRVGRRKLGLGSSAAATVAYVAARLAESSGADGFLETVHDIAHRAHHQVSARKDGGARSSGADVAASVYGGAIVVTPRVGDRPSVRSIEPPDRNTSTRGGLVWVVLDSGQSANTRTLVAGVDALAARDRETFSARIDDLATAAAAGIDALAANDSAAVIASIDAGRRALMALGRDAELSLVTPTHRQLAEIATKHGGASKSTGAGGGDAAVAVFADKAAAQQFCAEAMAAGIKPLELGVFAHGARVYSAKPSG